MTSPSLAESSNLAVYAAMAVLTLAMLAYAAYLAWLLPTRGAAGEPARVEERVEVLVRVGAGQDPTRALAAGLDELAEATTGVPLRARKAAGIGFSLTTLGALLLLAGVVLRGMSVRRWPLGNMYEFALMGCFFVLAAFLLWSRSRDLRWLGVTVVAPVLLTLGAAITVWYTEAAQLMPSLKSVWLSIHVTVATLSVALFGIGAALAALYLLRDRVPALDRLPDARSLERLAYSVHIVAFPLWTFTVIAGAIWARQAWGSYWNWDPKEVWSFVIWVAYAAYLHARATSGWSRRSAAIIALVGFGCIVVNYAVVNVFFVSQHSYSGL